MFYASIIIITCILLYKIHYSTEKEVVERFQAQQLLTTKQLAKEIEIWLQSESQSVKELSSLSLIRNGKTDQIDSSIQEYYDNLGKNNIQSVSVIDENGKIIYSTLKEAISTNYPDSNIIEWGKLRENKRKQLITTDVPLDFLPQTENSTFPVLIAAPIYSDNSKDHFAGVAFIVADLDNIITSFTRDDIVLATNRKAWIMDNDGYVLYHPDHPEMIMHNMKQQNKSCYKCHSSFNYIDTMLSRNSGTTEYQLKDKPLKLSSYATISYKNVSWKIVVNIPLDNVSNFVESNLQQTLLLFALIIMTLIGTAFSINHSNRLKIRAEEEVIHWRERHELEKKLRESENQYRTIVENSPNPIFIHSEGKIVYANPAGILTYGVKSASDILGKPVIDLVHPEDREIVKQRIKEMLEYGLPVPMIEERFITNDKRIIIAEVVSIPIMYNNKQAVQVIVSDITERKRSELERQVIYEVTLGVTTTSNLNELLTLIHQSLRKMLYADNCFVALYDQKTGLFNFQYFVDKFDSTPEPIAMRKSCTAYVFRTGKPLLLTPEIFQELKAQDEVELVGSPAPSWIGVPLQTPDRTIGVLVLQHYEEKNAYSERDVNFLNTVGSQVAIVVERKLAEQEIKQRSEQLIKSNAEKDKFFSIIAHDLRSPFSGFLGLTGLMAEGDEEFTKEELMKYNNAIHESASTLYKLIENLLEWAQMQKGSITFDPEMLNLADMVSQSIYIINNKALQKGISVISEIPADEEIYADEKMVDAVLRNLLSNAVKFTNRGGKAIVRVNKYDNEMVEVTVIDNGVGMSEEDVKKLFKMEEKVSSTGTEGEPSTGLGLLLCKEFVEKNTGKIWAESQKNKGSIFHFTLPKSNTFTI